MILTSILGLLALLGMGAATTPRDPDAPQPFPWVRVTLGLMVAGLIALLAMPLPSGA